MDQPWALLRFWQLVSGHPNLAAEGTKLIEQELGSFLQLFTSFLFSTADPLDPHRSITSIEVIHHYQPLTQVIADGALTVIVIWGFYKIMWVRASSWMSQVGLRQLLPRVCLSALLINFSLPLIQAAVDLNNVLCLGVENATHLTAVDFLTHDLAVEIAAPGSRALVAVVLLLAYVLLAISYVVRFVLLVLLIILAPFAGLLSVLSDTQHWTHQWSSLFIGTLLTQPLQLLVLALSIGLDAYTPLPAGHLFALAGVFICFKIPGPLRTSAMISGRAMSLGRRQGRRLLKAVKR
ncbi:MAG: hypothetical protein ACREP9_01095 [Candidatus Dormibacteraceae bacterium]